jgi:hypothetical protein
MVSGEGFRALVPGETLWAPASLVPNKFSKTSGKEGSILSPAGCGWLSKMHALCATEKAS